MIESGKVIKKKFLAVVLTIAMCTMLSVTALAASSSSESYSSSKANGSNNGKKIVTDSTKGTANTDSVMVAVVGVDGSVSKINLTL